MNKNILIFDVETTGIDPIKDRIVQFSSLVHFKGNEFIDPPIIG